MSSNQYLYSLIDIQEYRLKTEIVNQIYDYIIQSSWSVTDIVVSNTLSIGGPISNVNGFYSAYINGSVLIRHDCNINGNISIIGDSQLNTLTVYGDMNSKGNFILKNADVINIDAVYANISNNLNVIGNTSLNNLRVANGANISGQTNLSSLKVDNGANISGVLNVSSLTVEGIVNISGHANLSSLFVRNGAIISGQTNLSSLFVKNDANITGIINIFNGANISGVINVSSLNVMGIVNISGHTNLSSLSVRNGANISGQTNLSSLSIINNATIFGNTKINALELTTLTSTVKSFFNNGLEVMGGSNMSGGNRMDTLTVNTLTANAKSSIHSLDITNERLKVDKGILITKFDRLTAVDGNNFYSSVCDGTLYANEIYCQKINSKNYATTAEATDLTQQSVTSIIVSNKNFTYDKINYFVAFGFKSATETATTIGNNTIPIVINMYGDGAFVYGLTYDSTNVNTTFDLSANSALSGITYNGPFNIGQSTPNVFNVNATITHFSGGDMALDGNLILGGNVTSTSDKRLKENIIPLDDCLNKIKKIRGYNYTRNDLPDKNKKHLGLLAQEVEEVFPELVTETNNVKSINYQSFVAVLLECIKELNDKIENKIL